MAVGVNWGNNPIFVRFYGLQMNLLLEDRHDMFVHILIKVNPTNKVSLAMKFICGYKQSEQ